MYKIRVRQGEGAVTAVKVHSDDTTVREVLSAARVNMTSEKKASDQYGRSLTLDTIVTEDMGYIIVSNAPDKGR